MLVLSRQPQQSIVLKFRDVTLATITVKEIRGKTVTLAIDGDPMVKIWREELLPSIAPEPLAAFSPLPCDDPQLLLAGA